VLWRPGFQAPVAQLDRVSVFETEGWRFEPVRARHFYLDIPRLSGNKTGIKTEDKTLKSTRMLPKVPEKVPEFSIGGCPVACEDQAYMLDTNVFNAVVDGDISVAAFAGCRLLVIGVQRAELMATKCAARREALLAIAVEINLTTSLASTFAFGIEGAGFNQACWNDGSGTFEKMLDRLRQLDTKKKKKGVDDLNPDRDILTAETAIKNQAILVSNDNNLRQVVSEFMGKAITLTQFLDEIRA
jgi:hypothetical protein